MNELMTTMSHAHGRGDNLNSERDREEVWCKKERWEGFGTPTMINKLERSNYQGPTWQEILESRERNDGKLEGSSTLCAYNVVTMERFNAPSISAMSRLIARDNKSIVEAMNKEYVTGNFVIFDYSYNPTKEQLKAEIEKRISKSKRSYQTHKTSTMITHYAHNIWTGERIEMPSCQAMATFLNTTGQSINKNVTRKLICQKTYIIWSDRLKMEEDEIQERASKAVSKMRTSVVRS